MHMHNIDELTKEITAAYMLCRLDVDGIRLLWSLLQVYHSFDFFLAVYLQFTPLLLTVIIYLL